MSVESPDEYVEKLLAKLRSDVVTYFPIRHHSPACASHIEEWILHHRPKAVLVEGPQAFTSRMDCLTDEQCRCPVAMYTSFVDKKGRLQELAEGPAERARNEQAAGTRADEDSETDSDARADSDAAPNVDKSKRRKPTDESLFGPPRFGAYYPFCDYSPELVALRTGRLVGAKLRFIDLEYGDMVLARFQAQARQEKETVRIESLAEDPHLKHSAYIRALGRRLGCRDFNELWDHLFESCFKSLSTDAFIDRVAAYCAMARLDYTPEDLESDGTTAREACMASIICEEIKATGGPVLVVTGGFHTVVLPDLVAQNNSRPPGTQFAQDETGCWLMRYSFDQLDALAGYSAGMPSPAFYDRMWQAEKRLKDKERRVQEFERVSGDILVEISRLTRELKTPNIISTPDAIAAMQMTRQLASLRGHPWPLREDVLDGIRSCFVKGEMTIEGQVLFGLVKTVLAGNRVGQLPPNADLPPIIDDFYREANRFRLPVENVQRKEYTLDLYRSANHRLLSRFFHRLALLQAPFARLIGGPDFATGQFLDLIQERWSVAWSPVVESALIEASVFGTTIEDAAASKLKRQIATLEEEGEGRCSAIAVTLLIRACRLGLHGQSNALVPLIDLHINEDASLSSVVQALSQLELLDRSREPLEAAHLTAVPRLMAAAYQRACRLLQDVARCPDDAVDDVLRTLQTLREVLASSAGQEDEAHLDHDLFFHGLQTIINCAPHEAQSAVVGAGAGILYGEGRLSDDELIKVVCGYLGGAVNDPRKSAGILRGLLATSCEIAWQVTEVMRALDAQFQLWDEKTFLDLLPELRLAFTALAPRDVARVAEQISNLHNAPSMGELLFTDIDESEVHFALTLNRVVRQSLHADGLGGEP